MIYGVVAILAAVFFLYRLIVNELADHRLAQMRAQNDAEEAQFNNQVAAATKGIENAKLDYKNARDQFNADAGAIDRSGEANAVQLPKN